MGADIFVDQDALPGGDGTAWPKALRTLQSAFDLAEAGDTIFIAEGSYILSNTIPCLLYTSPSPRDQRGSRMPSSA